MPSPQNSTLGKGHSKREGWQPGPLSTQEIVGKLSDGESFVSDGLWKSWGLENLGVWQGVLKQPGCPSISQSQNSMFKQKGFVLAFELPLSPTGPLCQAEMQHSRSKQSWGNHRDGSHDGKNTATWRKPHWGDSISRKRRLVFSELSCSLELRKDAQRALHGSEDLHSPIRRGHHSSLHKPQRVRLGHLNRQSFQRLGIVNRGLNIR